MAKGFVAFMICVIITLSISITSGLGFYAAMDLQYSNSSADAVQDAADTMTGQTASDKSSSGGIVDFTTGAGRTLSTGWEVISNLSGILQLLFGAPKILADAIQTFFNLTFGISFAAAIMRGVPVQ